MENNWTHDLAWAAGFFDGEGTTATTSPDGNRREIKLSVNQVGREVLDRFRAAVLGIGAVYGPYPQRSPNHRPRHTYSVGGHESVQAIVAMLWTYLSSVKRAQARAALAEVLGWRRKCPHGVYMGKASARRAFKKCGECHREYHKTYNLTWRAQNPDKQHAYATSAKRKAYMRKYMREQRQRRLAEALLVAV